ncbi:MAG: PAS domain S-box protein [Propylenella sp.]
MSNHGVQRESEPRFRDVPVLADETEPPGDTQVDAGEVRYRAIFEGARVALWDQDFSLLLDRLDELRGEGVSDARAYFEARPEELAKAIPLVRVRDVNNYAAELFEAECKEALLGALGATFLPETNRVFLDEIAALWEGRRRFEAESLVGTLKGRRLKVLLTIAWGGERCEHSLVSILDISKQNASERRWKTLNRIAKTLSEDLDLERTVQSVTDIATELSGAKFGAFFYNTLGEQGESYLLYALSGAPREAFDKFGLPRNTAVFEPTFRGVGIVRSDDIRADPRYGRSAPHYGMPKGHLPVVSYLAVPVVSRSGEVLGGLFFGHDQPGVFTKESEELIVGIASHAAIAIDNARLLRAAQSELEQRRHAEELSNRLASIVESSGDAIVSKDLNGVIVSWNKGAERLFGYSAAEAVGQPITIVIPAEYQDEEPKILERIRRGDSVGPYETVRRRKDGSLFEVSLSVSPVKDAAGRTIGASKIARDITERRHAERSLARRMDEQAALYRFTDRLHRAESPNAVYDAALDAILRALRCDRASILLFDEADVMHFVAWRGLSDEYRRTVDGHSPWTPDETAPQPIVVDDVESAGFDDALKSAVRREGISALAFIPLVSKGKLVGKFMTYYEAPHPFPPEEIDLAVTIARQLGFSIERMRAEEARRKAEQELRESEARFRSMANTTPAIIWTADPAGGITFHNQRWLDYTGLARGENARDWTHVLHPDDYERCVEAWRRALEQGAEYEVEVRNRRHDGEFRWFLTRATPIRDADGHVVEWYGSTTDIHDRKLAEEALHKSEERFIRFMQHLPGLAWIKDVEGRYIYANDAAARVFRTGRGQLNGLTDEEIFPPEIAVQFTENDRKALASGTGIHVVETLEHEDGVLHHSLVSKFPMPGSSGQATQIGGMAIDITDRQHAEKALRESEERLQLSLEAGRMGAWEWDMASGKVVWSPGLERIHGIEEGSFGGTFEDFKRDVHPEDIESLVARIKEALETRRDYHVAYRIVRPDGALRWLEAFGRFAVGGNGALKLAGVCMDITDRKLAEVQRDLLVAELSHRVKNTLATVISIARRSFSNARSVEEASGAFSARIRALAQTHGRLAESNWSGVSLQTMLLDEFAPYRVEDGSNVGISGPPIVLSPRCALTIGMAVHELVTNAAKYGALSTPKGSVQVVWSTDIADRELRILWSESGGPPVSLPEHSGFGRLLIERALASELRGVVRLDFDKGGLTCAIAIPLDELHAAAGVGMPA